jgi:hypothetical protein
VAVVDVVVVVIQVILDEFPDAPRASPNVPDRFALAFPSWCSPSAAVDASEQQQ